MNNSPLVSIVVLSYNQENYIRQTLDSLVRQQHDHFEFEIVVGDDASKDSTRAIIMEYKQQHPGLLVVMPEAPNKGVVINYRDTLHACRGKYISLCAGDDYWHDAMKIQKQVTFLENNPDYNLVFTDINTLFDDRQSIIENYGTKYEQAVSEGFVFDKLIAGDFAIKALTVCFRRADFDKYVDFEEFVRAGFKYEDLPTWLELSRHGKFKYFPESTATYRILGNSLSNTKDLPKRIKFLEEHYNIKSYFIKKYNVDKAFVDRFETYYYNKRFMLGYKFNDYKEVAAAYRVLKSKNAVTFKTKIRKMLTKVPALKRATRSIQSIFSKEQSLFGEG
jgi:glycosyltransferase involved in cell wall biosynthesis